MALTKSSYRPNPEEITPVSPADVETPSEGNITIFANADVAGNPLSIKRADGTIVASSSNIALGLLNNTTFLTALLNSSSADVQGLYLSQYNTVSGGLTIKAGEVWEKGEGTGEASLTKAYDFVDAPAFAEVQQNSAVQGLTGGICIEGLYSKDGSTLEKWLHKSASFVVNAFIHNWSQLSTIKLSDVYYDKGMYLITSNFDHGGVNFFVGDIVEKIAGTNISSIKKVYNLATAPQVILVKQPLQLINNLPELTTIEGVYAKGAETYYYVADGLIRAVGIISSETELAAVCLSTELSKTAGLWLSNFSGDFTDAFGTLTVQSGGIYEKLSGTAGGNVNMATRYIASKAPTNIFVQHTDAFIASPPTGIETVTMGTYFRDVSGSVYTWVKAGTGTGGGGGTVGLKSFTIDNADGSDLETGALIEIKSDGTVQNIIQTIAGSGTGVLAIGKPNYNPNDEGGSFAYPPKVYQAMINNSVVILDLVNNAITVATRNETGWTWGDYKTSLDTGYEFLSAIYYASNGYQIDNSRVLFACSFLDPLAYNGFVVIELANDLQFSRGTIVNLDNTRPAGTTQFPSIVKLNYLNYYSAILYSVSSGGYRHYKFIYNPDVDFYNITSPFVYRSRTASNYASDFLMTSKIANYNEIDYYVVIYFYQSTVCEVAFLRQYVSNGNVSAAASFTFTAAYSYIRNADIIPFNLNPGSNLLKFYVFYVASTDTTTLKYYLMEYSTGGTFTRISSDVVLIDNMYDDGYIVNHPSETVWTVTYITRSDTSPEMRMQVYNIATNGTITLVKNGELDYHVLLTSDECTSTTELARKDAGTPIEITNGYANIIYNDSTNGNRTGIVVVKFDGATVISHDRFKGIAQAGGANGAEVEVAQLGETSAIHSGLFDGANYYLANDATLTTTYNERQIGYAASDTELRLIKELITNETSNATPQSIISSDGKYRVITDYYGQIAIFANDNLRCTIDGDKITFYDVPTSDPQRVGELWSDNDTLKLSAGV